MERIVLIIFSVILIMQNCLSQSADQERVITGVSVNTPGDKRTNEPKWISPGIINPTATDKSPAYSGIYLGQTPPGDQPVRFAPPGLRANSTWFWHGSPSFSPDLTEMFFVKYYQATNKTEINYMKMTEGVWSDPVPAPFSDTTWIENSPIFSQGGDTLFFYSQRPLGPFLYVIREGTGWTEPHNLQVPIPDSLETSWQFFISKSGTLYLDLWQTAGDLDIYRSDRQDGQYMEPVKLGPEINTGYHDWGANLDEQERVMIFASKRPGGYGLHDLYISHKDGDGWTPAENLGSNINGNNEDGFPALSPDGLYLFFTTAKPGDLGYNPYWVRADAVDPILGITSPQQEQANFLLDQNFPNPCSQTTMISFTQKRQENLKLSLFDLTGREVMVISDGITDRGRHNFNVYPDGLVPGIYMILLSNGEAFQAKKLILQK